MTDRHDIGLKMGPEMRQALLAGVSLQIALAKQLETYASHILAGLAVAALDAQGAIVLHKAKPMMLLDPQLPDHCIYQNEVRMGSEAARLIGAAPVATHGTFYSCHPEAWAKLPADEKAGYTLTQ